MCALTHPVEHLCQVILTSFQQAIQRTLKGDRQANIQTTMLTHFLDIKETQ